MKAIYSLFLFTFLFSVSSFGQIKYEGTVNAKNKTFQLEDGTFIYVKYDLLKQELMLFNLDNTLWRTVKLPLPPNHLLDEIKYISVNTFDADDEVELVYSCVEYDSNNFEDVKREYSSLQFTLNIINESGDLILKVLDSNEMEIIQSNGQNKLMVYKHIGQGLEEKDETIIYSLK